METKHAVGQDSETTVLISDHCPKYSNTTQTHSAFVGEARY